MRRITNVCLLALVLSASWIQQSVAQSQITPDQLDKVLAALFDRQSQKTLCLLQSSTRDSVRAAVKDHLHVEDTFDDVWVKAVTVAAYTALPCPFSPYRSELRAAASNDLIGTWRFPEDSQKFRYGPKSAGWSQAPGVLPPKCEGITYFKGGRQLVAVASGTRSCPTAREMKSFEEYPAVEFWSMNDAGRVTVTRTDVPNHVEEWDMFVVASAFDLAGTRFEKGDVLGYRRREQGNEVNATTMFRHLQRLAK
jgi:hypothetical protein